MTLDMNEEDIFRKIGFSLKFDKFNFQKNSQRFRTAPSKPFVISDLKQSSELDFFKSKQLPTLKLSEAENSIKPRDNKDALVQKSFDSCLSEDLEKDDVINAATEIIPNLHSSVANNASQASAKNSKLISSKYLRKMHKIYVEGSDVPGLITSFEQLHTLYNFNKTCLKNINETMGFTSLTPIQMQTIPALLHGREMLACAPTGSGKTLSFLIPVVHHLLRPNLEDINKKKKKCFRGLILSPTKELAEQTFHECKTLLLNGSAESRAKKPLLRVKILDKKETKVFSRTGALHSNKIDLLIATPNRIVHLLEQDPPLISLDDVEWLIVDESDKMFEKGETKLSFRHQLGQIYSACNNPKIRRAMFSATFAYDVQRWCVMNMENVLQVTVGGKNTAVETVEQELKYVGNEQGKLLALKEIILLGFSPPVLVFVQSKERAKELFAELLYEGKKVDAIHADRAASQRENAVKSFRRGDTWILICTELMGRGIDFKGVNLVVNYDFPTSAISYIHRIGRTGRAGRKGRAVTFFTDEDRPLLRSIANVVRQAGCEVPEYMLKLKKPQKRDLKQIARTERKRSTIRTAPPDVLNKRRKVSSKTKLGSKTKLNSKSKSGRNSETKSFSKSQRKQKSGEAGNKTNLNSKSKTGKNFKTKLFSKSQQHRKSAKARNKTSLNSKSKAGKNSKTKSFPNQNKSKKA